MCEYVNHAGVYDGRGVRVGGRKEGSEMSSQNRARFLSSFLNCKEECAQGSQGEVWPCKEGQKVSKKT